jgi:hypothetical protein
VVWGRTADEVLRAGGVGPDFEAAGADPASPLTSIHRTTAHRFGPREDSLPVDAFLEKPVPADQLLDTIDALLKKKNSPAAN